MADAHKDAAERLLDLADEGQAHTLAAAQVQATLHLAEKVADVAMVLDYIDAKLGGSSR